MNLIEHTLLTLDFWQDNVTYEGKSMPTGTLACAALNLSDEVIAKLSQLCMPLNLYMGSSLANASVQYAVATIPGKEKSQLVKRMHYVSFVGMFRSDLFEGLCVGHAPRKCPICGTWFLTTDARPTKYCGGLAPGDKRGRTCRQVGNLRGREQRERADDHPLKKIYERRTNTIIQKLHRGTLDEQTAAVMKRLAKNKLERAIADREYAAGSYETEMTQEALLAEAQNYLK